MTAELAEVLELIHSSRSRFRSVRAVGRRKECGWRMWWVDDAHWRFETDSPRGSHASVRNGPTWWTYESTGEAHTNDGEPGVGLGLDPDFALVHTRSLLAAFVLEVLGEQEVAGRRAVLLRATPRPGGGDWRWWEVLDPAKEPPSEVVIDLERGVALKNSWTEVTEIFFDEEVEPAVFSRPYPEDLRRVHRTRDEPLEMSLEEAREQVTFPVRLPSFLPEGARLLRCVVDPLDPPEWVGLSWAFDPGHRAGLHLRQGPAVDREAAMYRGVEVQRKGTRVLVPDHEESGYFQDVVAEHDGYWVELGSDLPRDVIVDIAASVGEAS
ncbi:MAG: hypothetical protein ACRDH9_11180 [Actinomycetota bacterium]